MGSGGRGRAPAELRVCAQLCPTLCDPMDYNPPGPSVHGISQARILEWVAISSSRGSSWPRDWTRVSVSPASAGRFFICANWLFLSWGKKKRSFLPLAHQLLQTCPHPFLAPCVWSSKLKSSRALSLVWNFRSRQDAGVKMKCYSPPVGNSMHILEYNWKRSPLTRLML